MKRRIPAVILVFCILLINIPWVATANAAETLDTSRYYYGQLNAQEKKIYDALREQLYGPNCVSVPMEAEYEDQVFVSMISRATRALEADCPEYTMYWQGYIISHGNPFVIERSAVNAPEWLIDTAKARLDQYVASIDTSADRFTQIYELYKIFYSETYYDGFYKFIYNTGDDFIHTALGCLGYGISVCDGFAYSVKLICDRLGIPCIVVAGCNLGAYEGHAWNYIQMDDGQWYNFDATDKRDVSLSILSGANAVMDEEAMLNGTLGDFAFPTLAETAYVYNGTVSDSYTLAKNDYLDAPGTFVYEVNDDRKTCTITGYHGAQGGDLIIPETVDGYTVTAIGPMAFYGHFRFTGDIILPDTVTTIGDSAFQQCYGIQGNLILPKNLESIGASAFLGNMGMSGSLELPDKLESIGFYAFHYCTSLTGNVILPDSLKELSAPFVDCVGLTGVLHIPDGVIVDFGISLGTSFSAFSVNETNPNYTIYDDVLYSKDMTTLIVCPPGKTGTLTIPDGVLCIKENACSRIEGLSGNLVLPEGLETIEYWAFGVTRFSGDLIIPDSVTTIGPYAFNDAGFDGILKLPANLQRIEDFAFSGCHFTGELDLPESVTYIGDYAFYQAEFSGDYVIPPNVQYVGSNFSGYLQSATFLGDAPDVHFGAFVLAGMDSKIYYPANGSGWDAVIHQEYNEAPGLTWIATDCPLVLEGVSGHDWQSTFTGPSLETRTCTACDAQYSIEHPDPFITRIYGSNRYETAFKVAETVRSQISDGKFQNIVVASGTGFADALSGSYLAAIKSAPILLVKDHNTMNQVKEYIQANLAPGGTVYLLGGTAAVPAAMETGLEGFTVKRLGGANRYETNLLIIREVENSEPWTKGLSVLVCTGKDFADSLSASAVGLPILLVRDELTPEQESYLQNNPCPKHIIGGTNAVNQRIENKLKEYGEVTRIGGATRYETSVLVAEEFFYPITCVLAYAGNFPDGLSGSALARQLHAPLILTASGKQNVAAEYAESRGITTGFVLGGPTLINDKAVREIFAMEDSDIIYIP